MACGAEFPFDKYVESMDDAFEDEIADVPCDRF
jgi:hypothetical protein